MKQKIIFQVDEKKIEEIKNISKAHGMSLSAFCRMSIFQNMKKMEDSSE